QALGLPNQPFLDRGVRAGGSPFKKTRSASWANGMRTTCYHFATELGSTARYSLTRRRCESRENPDNLGLPDTEQNREARSLANFGCGVFTLSAPSPQVPNQYGGRGGVGALFWARVAGQTRRGGLYSTRANWRTCRSGGGVGPPIRENTFGGPVPPSCR